MPVIDPLTITGERLGAVNEPTLANRNSKSVSNTVSYSPVLMLGSAWKESSKLRSRCPTICSPINTKLTRSINCFNASKRFINIP